MICTAVPREAVDIVWGDVSSMLNKAIQTSGGKYHIDDIYQHLTEGYYNLWLIIDEEKEEKVIAAITTRIIQYPSKKAMAMDWIGGTRMMEWLPIAMDRLISFAKKTLYYLILNIF